MDPVKTNAETFGNNVDRVSSALKTYAAEVEPIKAELARIKAEAYSFVASIAGGVEKTTFSRAGAITSTVEWHEDQDSVDANNDLIRRVNAQMVLLWAAERKCANAIYDIIGFPHIEAATEDNPNGYGVTEIPDGAERPRGVRRSSVVSPAVRRPSERWGASSGMAWSSGASGAPLSDSAPSRWLQPADRGVVRRRHLRGRLEQPRQACGGARGDQPAWHLDDRQHAWASGQLPSRFPDDGAQCRQGVACLGQVEG